MAGTGWRRNTEWWMVNGEWWIVVRCVLFHSWHSVNSICHRSTFIIRGFATWLKTKLKSNNIATRLGVQLNYNILKTKCLKLSHIPALTLTRLLQLVLRTLILLKSYSLYFLCDRFDSGWGWWQKSHRWHDHINLNELSRKWAICCFLRLPSPWKRYEYT